MGKGRPCAGPFLFDSLYLCAEIVARCIASALLQQFSVDTQRPNGR
jgi:hypothetical protein